MTVNKNIIHSLGHPKSGDYYKNGVYYCVAYEPDGPKVIGQYTERAVLENPQAKKHISAMIWRNYFNCERR